MRILYFLTPVLCSIVNGDDWVETEVDGVLDHVDNPILRPHDLLEWILGE